ncbi:MAG: sugar-binding transcriptional regulator [Arthrobacter sp.]
MNRTVHYMLRGSDAASNHARDAVMQAAWFYYHDDLTQSEIGQRLGLSRATVGRMLRTAREQELVTIKLHPSLHSAYGLGAELAGKFGLEAAVVVPGSTFGLAETTERLASAGSRYLSSSISRGQTLAVGWGNTVSRALLGLPKGTLDDVQVVTLTGGADAYLRALLGASGESRAQDARVVPAPLLASSPALAEALLAERSVSAALAAARAADHAVIGIGSTHPESTVVQLGYLSAAEIQVLTRRGAVGDMLGRFYDADGMVIDMEIYSRTIGTDLSQLKAMRNVIAMAGGQQKVAAIKGALRGRYINILVTDDATARTLMNS